MSYSDILNDTKLKIYQSFRIVIFVENVTPLHVSQQNRFQEVASIKNSVGLTNYLTFSVVDFLLTEEFVVKRVVTVLLVQVVSGHS